MPVWVRPRLVGRRGRVPRLQTDQGGRPRVGESGVHALMQRHCLPSCRHLLMRRCCSSRSDDGEPSLRRLCDRVRGIDCHQAHLARLPHRGYYSGGGPDVVAVTQAHCLDLSGTPRARLALVADKVQESHCGDHRGEDGTTVQRSVLKRKRSILPRENYYL